MKRRYELTVIFSPELSTTDLKKSQKSVEDLIVKWEGKLVKKDDWGTRDLAYEIDKQTKGVYWFYLIEIPGKSIKELTSALRLSMGIMRYLLIRES